MEGHVDFYHTNFSSQSHPCHPEFLDVEKLAFTLSLARLCADFGPTLGQLCADFGPTLGRLWADFGSTLARLWADSGTILGRLWANFGPILGQLWADLGPTLGPFSVDFKPTVAWPRMLKNFWFSLFSSMDRHPCKLDPRPQGKAQTTRTLRSCSREKVHTV